MLATKYFPLAQPAFNLLLLENNWPLFIVVYRSCCVALASLLYPIEISLAMISSFVIVLMFDYHVLFNDFINPSLYFTTFPVICFMNSVISL